MIRALIDEIRRFPSLLARTQKAEADADELRRQLLDETYRPEGGEIIMRELRQAKAERDELRDEVAEVRQQYAIAAPYYSMYYEADRHRDALAARLASAEVERDRWKSEALRHSENYENQFYARKAAEAERDVLRAQVVELLCPRCMSGPKGACGCYADGPSVGDQLGAEVLRLGIERDALAARLASAEAKLATVGEWAMANEIAAPPLDWAGLGAALAADATPEPTFERLLSDPNTIVWLKDHGTPEVRRTLRELEASIEAYRNAPSNTISVPPSAIPEQEAGNDE